MRYVSATVKGYSAVKTKKALREQVARINAGEMGVDVDVEVSDPMGMGYGTMGVKDLLGADLQGTALQVANDRRTWFATVQASNGKLKVT